MEKEKIISNYIKSNQLDMSEIVSDYYCYVKTIIKNATNVSKEDEEEIISDVFFIVWKNQRDLKLDNRLSPYIAGITKRVVYKKYYKDSKYNEASSKYQEEFIDLLSKNFQEDIDNQIEKNEMINFINEQLKLMGEMNYLVFTKFYYEDKSIKQIAKELNLSSSNVKILLHRSRNKVKNLLILGGMM
jgi:RNA polymerase sigma-70 factor (ECF subfamily)